MRLARVLWILMAVAAVDTAGGQGSGQAPVPSGRQGTLIPIPYRTYVAIDPSLVVFDFGALELESGVAQGVTIGGVGSLTTVDGNRYASADFNLRYYPGDVVLRGLSFGLSAGGLRYSTRDSVGGRVYLNTPTVGILAHYNWMLGTTHRFVVGTGVGAKRVLTSADERRRVDLGRAYVTARFVVGYAF